MPKPLVNIVIALHCEAKPLINFFKLKKISAIDLPFPIFVNSDQSIHLIISGVGKIKSAAATTFLYCWTERKNFSSFLNIGIAGSSELALGQCVLANKITDANTMRSWYPFISPLKNKTQTQLISYDSPQCSYPLCGMIDMEGSAFFQTAAMLVSQEHIQVVKIISDQDRQSQDLLNKINVEKLIEDNLEKIVEIINYLLELSKQENLLSQDPNKFAEFQNAFHFTHSQKLQLHEYLRRWQVQMPNLDAWDICKQEKNATAVLNKLSYYANYLY